MEVLGDRKETGVWLMQNLNLALLRSIRIIILFMMAGMNKCNIKILRSPYPCFFSVPQHLHPYDLEARGMVNAEFKSRTSPFYPDYNTVYDGGNEYQGVFLNQDPTQTPTYYKLWAGNQLINLGSPIGVRQFFFQNWSATGATLQTFGNDANVVFTSGNAIVQANLKGQGLSNDQNAFFNSSQRKFAKTSNGDLHYVYSSLG